MKTKAIDPISHRIQSNSVLPAGSAAYVAELARDPSKARDFLIRAGIIEKSPRKTRVTAKSLKLALDAA
jgi:hypothetical protein